MVISCRSNMIKSDQWSDSFWLTKISSHIRNVSACRHCGAHVTHGDRHLATLLAPKLNWLRGADKAAQLDSTENQATQLKQPPSFNDEQLTTLVSPSVSFFSPPTAPLYTYILSFPLVSFDFKTRQSSWIADHDVQTVLDVVSCLS